MPQSTCYAVSVVMCHARALETRLRARTRTHKTKKKAQTTSSHTLLHSLQGVLNPTMTNIFLHKRPDRLFISSRHDKLRHPLHFPYSYVIPYMLLRLARKRCLFAAELSKARVSVCVRVNERRLGASFSIAYMLVAPLNLCPI